jgi:hypothetical protein
MFLVLLPLGSQFSLHTAVLKKISVDMTFKTGFSMCLKGFRKRHTGSITIIQAEFSFRNKSKSDYYLRTLQVLTCHTLKQVMCTHFFHESIPLFEQKVMFYTSAEQEGGCLNAKQAAVSQHFVLWNFFSDNT